MEHERSRERVVGAGASGALERWFEDFLREVGEPGERLPPLRDWVDLAEAWRIARALRDARGNRTAAARSLGIGRRTLYAKMERLGLEPVWWTRRTPDRATRIGAPANASQPG